MHWIQAAVHSASVPYLCTFWPMFNFLAATSSSDFSPSMWTELLIAYFTVHHGHPVFWTSFPRLSSNPSLSHSPHFRCHFISFDSHPSLFHLFHPFVLSLQAQNLLDHQVLSTTDCRLCRNVFSVFRPNAKRFFNYRLFSLVFFKTEKLLRFF